MIFKETALRGSFLVEPECLRDERGFFARIVCRKEFEINGLISDFVQTSISFNARKGTLRGMHYQIEPFEEIKLVRCTLGAIYDVIIDIRSESPTFKRWIAVELTAENRKMLYVPKGMAHGFQTMEDHTEVLYQISEYYHPESARGIRWNDPELAIQWPKAERIISDKDLNYGNLAV